MPHSYRAGRGSLSVTVIGDDTNVRLGQWFWDPTTSLVLKERGVLTGFGLLNRLAALARFLDSAARRIRGSWRMGADLA